MFINKYKLKETNIIVRRIELFNFVFFILCNRPGFIIKEYEETNTTTIVRHYFSIVKSISDPAYIYRVICKNIVLYITKKG